MYALQSFAESPCYMYIPITDMFVNSFWGLRPASIRKFAAQISHQFIIYPRHSELKKSYSLLYSSSVVYILFVLKQKYIF